MNSYRILTFSLVALFLATNTLAESEPVGNSLPGTLRFLIRDLGIPLGGTTAEAHDVNDRGDVVGSSLTADGDKHAFAWNDGNTLDLGTLGGAISDARSINNNRVIAGFSSTSNGDRHAFAWTRANGMVDLGTLGGTFSTARGINENNDIVGWSTDDEGQTFPFIYRNGEMTALPSNGIEAFATDINDLRQVSGHTKNRGISVIWSLSEAIRGRSILGGLERAEDNTVNAINNRGQLAGKSSFTGGNGNRKAALWKLDTDADNIFDEIDLDITNFSNEFNDSALGGQTNGVIVDRRIGRFAIFDDSGNGIVIIGAPDEEVPDGIIDTCDGATRHDLDTTDEIKATCNSSDTEVIKGPVGLTLTANDGLKATTSVGSGNAIFFEPTNGLFEAPTSNNEDIVLTIGETDITLAPGDRKALRKATADSFISRQQDDENEGANPLLTVGRKGRTHHSRSHIRISRRGDRLRGLVQFDLNNLPALPLNHATLALAADTVETSNRPDPRALNDAIRACFREAREKIRNGELDDLHDFFTHCLRDAREQAASDAFTVTAHRVLEEWTEGNGQFSNGDRGTGDGVTWDCAIDEDISNRRSNCDDRWNGGTFADATAEGATHDEETTSASWDVTQDVKDGAGLGWLLRADARPGSHVHYHSKESESPALLVITYEPATA